ncbi:MAG: UDP-3-O-acyl-N-acetylglucosamine deacetylase [Candidatus Aminicenantes bacterium]|nr:UDP-3-O-acyl-N-acetylglucosamine deacetylase [Candidatus Aminicenantes bacterium]
MKQKTTLQKEIRLSGIGIHTGKKVDIQLKPSSFGKIVFRRTDLDGLELALDPGIVKTKNSTYLESKGCRIQTLEHLLAVLYIFGIDSLIVELDGEEIPIMDGSASPFVQAVQDSGLQPLPEQKKIVKIIKPFRLEEEGASVSFGPDAAFRITYCIEYDHPLIQRQELTLDVNKESFVTEIAPSRTFGFLKDVPALRAQDLALGGSLENAVVLDDKGSISGPLRFPDECVRHKILDLIGDLSLLGSPVIGHFSAHRAGHRLHLKAVRFLLHNPEYAKAIP